MNKNDEIAVKTDIRKRLRNSNKELWESISDNEREGVVDEYYHQWDIEKIGLSGILRESREQRKTLSMLGVGVFFGIMGNFATDIFLKYFPRGSYLFDIVFVLFFVVFFVYFFREINKLDSENLGKDRVLEHLIKAVREKKE